MRILRLSVIRYPILAISFKLIALFSLCLFLISACTPEQSNLRFKSWAYSDLRLLDAVDSSDPEQDLIALYTRDTADEIQIRLDFLDLDPFPDYDLYLALDHLPGGRFDLPINAVSELAWDTLVVIPAAGSLAVFNSDQSLRRGAALRVQRDPILDSLTISLNRFALSAGLDSFSRIGPYRLQVLLTPAGSKDLSDLLTPISGDAPAPPPAQVLFAFWNSFPAYSPLTALRRWDGAHTGPLGGRHGLFNLLRTAHAANIPVVLLDLKNPSWVSALDFADERQILHDMLAARLLVLPDVLPETTYSPLPLEPWVTERILEINRLKAPAFGLSSSQFLFAPSELPNGDVQTRLVFIPSAEPDPGSPPRSTTSIGHLHGYRVLPIPYYDTSSAPLQAATDGLSLEVRQSLIETAIASGYTQQAGLSTIFVLGGPLTASTWGVPENARAAFHYLNAHPWIKPLDGYDLLSSAFEIQSRTDNPNLITFDSRGEESSPVIISSEAVQELLDALRRAPSNPIGGAAWDAYIATFAPLYAPSPDLPALRAQYLGDIWSLIEAAEWAENPEAISNCNLDPDHDGYTECILASERLYTQFETDSGMLTHAFSITPSRVRDDEVHQLIAPSSQMIVGLSDPLFWDLSAGSAADPYVINGAFNEGGTDYQTNLTGSTLEFISAKMGLRKIFRLIPEGFLIEYSFTDIPKDITIQVPLALDPWERFTSGWEDRYQGELSPTGWSWTLNPDLRIGIQTSEPVEVYTFLDSQQYFPYPENPNQDYPPGHRLPFPYAMVEISSISDFSVQVVVAEP